MTPSALAAYCKRLESAEFWREVAPQLGIDGTTTTAGAAVAPGTPVDLPRAWSEDGYLKIDACLHPRHAATLAETMGRMRSLGVHPTFVYVYDEAWSVLDALRPWLAAILGQDFEVLADVWAWYIDPRVDLGGWPIHRGSYENVTGASGTAGGVNAWVSLSHASERNACMHIVPSSADPHFPGDLRNLRGLERIGKAVTTDPGSALIWNANVAHWGGRCDPTCSEPRVSLSFTARRVKGPWGDVPLVRGRQTFRERLDLIAREFHTYGSKELSSGSPELQWASIRRTMGRLGGREA